MINLFGSISASADVSHYAMVIVDGGTSQREIINLKEGAKQNNVLTVSINSTWVSSELSLLP